MDSDARGWESGQLRNLRAQLQRSPALVERILATLPRAPAAPGAVIVRVRPADVDRSVCRALVLAVHGIMARVELMEE